MMTVNQASIDLRSRLRPGHRNRFLATCWVIVDPPRVSRAFAVDRGRLYASSDGGRTFSADLKVTDCPIPNPIGGRTIGDYLDMVVAYDDVVYIAHPCGGVSLSSWGTCLAAVDPRVKVPVPRKALKSAQDPGR